MLILEIWGGKGSYSMSPLAEYYNLNRSRIDEEVVSYAVLCAKGDPIIMAIVSEVAADEKNPKIPDLTHIDVKTPIAIWCISGQQGDIVKFLPETK